MVSVDAKHHVYLLTRFNMTFSERFPCGRKATLQQYDFSGGPEQLLNAVGAGVTSGRMNFI